MAKSQSKKTGALTKHTDFTPSEKHFGNVISGSCSVEVPSHAFTSSSLGLGLSLQPPIDENDQVVMYALGDHTGIAEV